MHNCHVQGLGNREGGSRGNLPPPQLGSCGVTAAQTLGCQCRSFLFLFSVFARGLGSLPQKMVGQIRGVFNFGQGFTLDPGDIHPPPPTSK